MEENNLVKERKKKLNNLKEMGVNPYPYKYDVTTNSLEINKKYDYLKPEEKAEDVISIAGRIMQIRKMGKIAFMHVQDSFGKIQIYIRKDDVGEQFKIFKKLDLGDIIGVKGKIFATKTGEITLEVLDLTLLAKTLRPLPEKYHGLKNEEIRYRKRYLDLIVNPEIKEVFIKRSKVIKAVREFLDSKGFIEVQTPILQNIYGGANARPFKTHINAWNMPMYLRISPELALKRLLVGGFDKVYDLNYNFRNEGSDKTHNPEFTMIEFYWAYADREMIMNLTEELWEYVAIKVNGSTKFKYGDNVIDVKRPWNRMTMKEAVIKYAKIDVDKLNDDELKDILRGYNIEFEGDFSKSTALVLLFEELVEDKLIQPTQILEHPREITPLAKSTTYNSEFVDRTEAFINGWEVINGFSELNDPILQKEILIEQEEKGRGGDEEAHPMDEDFIEALEYGMPPAGGMGLGIDRMVMLLLGQSSIRDVILFPTMKQEIDK